MTELVFERDERKNRENRRKHGVSFDEAKAVFFDDNAVEFYDDDHSGWEDRFLMLGLSLKQRVLMVCHCERGGGDVIRIISARKATRREQEFYCGGKK
jgi:uncharacterized DUF497 family protein